MIFSGVIFITCISCTICVSSVFLCCHSDASMIWSFSVQRNTKVPVPVHISILSVEYSSLTSVYWFKLPLYPTILSVPVKHSLSPARRAVSCSQPPFDPKKGVLENVGKGPLKATVWQQLHRRYVLLENSLPLSRLLFRAFYKRRKLGNRETSFPGWILRGF